MYVLLILFQFFLTTRIAVLRNHLRAKESLRRSLILKISEKILSGVGCLKVSREATRFRLNITDAFTILFLASNKKENATVILAIINYVNVYLI